MERNANSSSSDGSKKTAEQTGGASGVGRGSGKGKNNRTKDDSADESNPVLVLFNENQVLTVESTNTITRALKERDIEMWPLNNHEIDLMRELSKAADDETNKVSSFDENHILTEDAAKVSAKIP